MPTGAECCDGPCPSGHADLPADLSERDQRILFQLACGDDLEVGFQGLRRRLDIHQESLRRALKRLVERGLVRRGRYGYGLTEQAWTAAGPAAYACGAESSITLATTVLPADTDPEAVVENLSRRWFDGLRWYGISQGPGETSLLWETDAGGFLRLRLGGGTARIQGAGRHANEDATVRRAATLLAALADAFREERKDASVAPEALASHGDWAA